MLSDEELEKIATLLMQKLIARGYFPIYNYNIQSTYIPPTFHTGPVYCGSVGTNAQ